MTSPAPETGHFCWIELASTDASAAKAFYTEVLGWTHQDDEVAPGMVYSMLQKDGKNVGAMYGMPPEMKDMGIPSHWLTYVSVEDADASAEKARSLGATVVREPMDVFDIGRMAVFADPTGAHLAVWQPKKAVGFEARNGPNTFCWAELLTRDVPAAKAFYTELFGWETKASQAAPEMDYTEFYRDGVAIGGLMAAPPEMEGVPPHWMIYLQVEDPDDFVARAQAQGGQAIVPPQDIPGVGRFAVLCDPSGGAFSVIRLSVEHHA